jgi:hypothetical protein
MGRNSASRGVDEMLDHGDASCGIAHSLLFFHDRSSPAARSLFHIF